MQRLTAAELDPLTQAWDSFHDPLSMLLFPTGGGEVAKQPALSPIPVTSFLSWWQGV